MEEMTNSTVHDEQSSEDCLAERSVIKTNVTVVRTKQGQKVKKAFFKLTQSHKNNNGSHKRRKQNGKANKTFDC